MIQIIIRQIQKKDYQSTIETIHDSIKGSFPKIRPRELTPYFCEKYSYHRFVKRAKSIMMFVAVDSQEDKVVGVIGLRDNQLRTFFVRTCYQNKGIGRQLYERLELEARNQGVTRITLEGSPFGVQAYKKFGFLLLAEKHKEKWGYLYCDFVMEKVL